MGGGGRGERASVRECASVYTHTYIRLQHGNTSLIYYLYNNNIKNTIYIKYNK